MVSGRQKARQQVGVQCCPAMPPTRRPSRAPTAFPAVMVQIMIWVLGQDLPQGEDAGLASQVFAVLTVTLGLASFALVLALIEQVGGHAAREAWQVREACHVAPHVLVPCLGGSCSVCFRAGLSLPCEAWYLTTATEAASLILS